MTRRVVISALLAFALLAAFAGSAMAATRTTHNTTSALTTQKVSCTTPGAVSVFLDANGGKECYAGVGSQVNVALGFYKLCAGKWHVTVYFIADISPYGTAILNPGQCWVSTAYFESGYAFDITS